METVTLTPGRGDNPRRFVALLCRSKATVALQETIADSRRHLRLERRSRQAASVCRPKGGRSRRSGEHGQRLKLSSFSREASEAGGPPDDEGARAQGRARPKVKTAAPLPEGEQGPGGGALGCDRLGFPLQLCVYAFALPPCVEARNLCCTLL